HLNPYSSFTTNSPLQFFFQHSAQHRPLPSFPTRRSSDLLALQAHQSPRAPISSLLRRPNPIRRSTIPGPGSPEGTAPTTHCRSTSIAASAVDSHYPASIPAPCCSTTVIRSMPQRPVTVPLSPRIPSIFIPIAASARSTCAMSPSFPAHTFCQSAAASATPTIGTASPT